MEMLFISRLKVALMIEFSLDNFLFRALLGGLLVALTAAPVGCFIVWRRMAYFGETLSHSALLGIALGFLLGIKPIVGVLAVAIAAGILLTLMQTRKQLADDTLLGILAHGSLALGLVSLSLMETLRIDLLSYLFGDLLVISIDDLIRVSIGAVLILGTLIALWRPLLNITLDEELAAVEGVNTLLVRVGFIIIIALTVALTMKVVGILLVTSLLIIPPASARKFSRTPEQMAIGAAIIAALSVIGGMIAALQWDLPAGPAIVVTATLIFALSYIWPVRA